LLIQQSPGRQNSSFQNAGLPSIKWCAINSPAASSVCSWDILILCIVAWHHSPQNVHAGLRHLKHQQHSPRLAGNPRAPALQGCRAYQQSQASNALQQSAQLSQQQQQQQEPLQETEERAFDAERHQHIVEDYDLTYW
jgi:hypothetical protein